jgi:nitrogen regulatory protein P-II 1
MNHLAIVAIVERGKAESIVNKAKHIGAIGATILYGRGTGTHESHKLLNLHIESSKEIIIILSEEDKYRPIYDVLVQHGKLNQPGTGIIFTVPVDNVVGLIQASTNKK